jgi:hypothetical protein
MVLQKGRRLEMSAVRPFQCQLDAVLATPDIGGGKLGGVSQDTLHDSWRLPVIGEFGGPRLVAGEKLISPELRLELREESVPGEQDELVGKACFVGRLFTITHGCPALSLTRTRISGRWHK